MIKRLSNYLWNSATFNTWFNLSVTPLNTILFLPLLLRKFSVDELALWLLFSLYISLQTLADFGFYNTFVRVFSYAFAGRVSIDSPNLNSNKQPNWKLIIKINNTMNSIYLYATAILFFFLVLLSSTVIRPIGLIDKPSLEYWLSWFIIILFSLINFNGRRYSNIFLGCNRVAFVRRVQALFSFLTLILNLIAIIFFNSFILLVFSNQICHLFRVLFFRFKFREVFNDNLKKMNQITIHKDVFKSIWAPAWKGGISSISSTGTIKFSGIIYAQLANSEKLAQYLIALKILEIIKNISMAPFYSKIPLLSKYYAQNKMDNWASLAKNRIFSSNLLLIFGILFFGFFGSTIFEKISSNIVFPSLLLWYMLATAKFFHRLGAMHTQLYMTSNKVNSHISDTISGLIFLSSSVLLYNQYGIYSFAIGMLLAYLGFYIWYSMFYSYQIINNSILKFEFHVTLLPLSFLLITQYLHLLCH